MMRFLGFFASLVLCSVLAAQVYSPKVLAAGQPDSTDMVRFVQAIYAQAHAQTQRQKAEAIWRFFLTDGRYVDAGFWYHIAGWAYEEPNGEVLDPLKLLNSYGFGLCYHIAPLLQAAFKAGGFEDARCWFLTGHTVTEVFYDGAYHYYDSDMMGYNVAGDGSFREKPVASVHQIENDPSIMLGKLAAPDRVKEGSVPFPWYPADVHEKAIGDLANLFATKNDNFLYPNLRYSPGHAMDFVLRPGEKLIRFFKPELPRLFYLPYAFDGQTWTEFPKPVNEYQIRTEDGPHSQRDKRLWATGRIEYSPKRVPDQPVTVVSMPSPYVVIDARFSMHAELKTAQDSLRVETSIDGGHTWTMAGELNGPHNSDWSTEPHVVVKSEHGRLTAVSGTYGYDVKFTKSAGASILPGSLLLLSRLEINPRALPPMHPGENSFAYSSAPPIERIAIPAPLAQAPVQGLEFISEQGQELLHPIDSKGEVTYVLQAGGRSLVGFDVGARFLDLSEGLAPDKLTAETRHTNVKTHKGDASIVWSASPDGPFQPLWTYPAEVTWRDGTSIDRLLLWPEAFEQVRKLPAGTKHIYVKLRTAGPAIDSIRLAAYAEAPPPSGRLTITQIWIDQGLRRKHDEEIPAQSREHLFTISAGTDVQNEAIIFAVE